MEIKGKITHILPEQTGEGKNGTWRKNSFVIEIPGQFTKSVAIMVWGDKWNEYQLAIGEEITAHIDIESREWQGKWFTDVKAWKIEKGAGIEAPPPPAENTGFTAPPPVQNAPAGEEPDFDDDLPF